jgi:Protein of unknown function (DUF2605)
MSFDRSSEKELLRKVLEPLLEDFQYWFDRSHNLLESEKLSFLTEAEQAALLSRVKQTQQEVSTAQMLFAATEGKAGIEASILVPWHQLVAECWQVAMKYRSLSGNLAAQNPSDNFSDSPDTDGTQIP